MFSASTTICSRDGTADSAARSTSRYLFGEWPHGVDVGVAPQQCADFGFAEPTVAAGGPDAADTTGRRPARDGLGIDPKQAGNLSGCEESITVLHVVCLSSGRVLSCA